MAKIKITEQQARLLGLKPNIKVKLTQEQFDRIFTSGLIKENEEVKGGVARVDKAFKQKFAGKKIQNLKETEFNIQHPNPSLPSSVQKNFGKSKVSDLKKETIDLIKYMYRKDENFSPFWGDHGLTYEEICDSLMNKKMVVAENGKFTVSKSLGDAQKAIQMIENALKEMIGGDDLTELSNYPAGAEYDSRAPWNQKEPEYTQTIKPQQTPFTLITMNPEIALLKGDDGMYVFYHYDLGEEQLSPYTEIEQYAVGRDEDGDIEYEYGDFEKTPEGLEDYINDNINNVKTGEGFDAYEEGAELVKIDTELSNHLLSLFDKDKNITKALGSVNEDMETPEEKMARIKRVIAAKKAESEKYDAERFAKLDAQNAIDTARAEEKMRQQMMTPDEPEDDDNEPSPDTFFGLPWDQVEETTTAASSGAFVAPIGSQVISKTDDDINNLNVPVVGENYKLANGYTHFAIFKENGKIATGWDYSNLYDKNEKTYDNISIREYAKQDIIDMFPEKKLSDFKILTRRFLEKNGVNPSDSNNWFKVDINEVTSTASAGSFQYDANALPGIKRDGTFTTPKKTKAQTKTQYAGGSFVDFNDCVKLNNKPAGSGCSTGAVDNVVKLKKTSGNIVSPSLSEGKSVKKQ